MQKFIGIKIVSATPMTREYAETNHDVVVGGSNHGDGYLVVYDNDYKSWSPKAVFDAAYRPTNGMSFGLAIEAAKLGKKIARRGWNGKNQWVVLMLALNLPPFSCQEPGARVNDRTAKHIGPDTPLDSQPYFAMWTALGQWQPGWLASQADMLAEDWEVV